MVLACGWAGPEESAIAGISGSQAPRENLGGAGEFGQKAVEGPEAVVSIEGDAFEHAARLAADGDLKRGAHHGGDVLGLLLPHVEFAEETGGLEFAEGRYGSVDDGLGGGAVAAELAHFGGGFGNDAGGVVVLLAEGVHEQFDLMQTGVAVEVLLEGLLLHDAGGEQLGAHFGFEFEEPGGLFGVHGEDTEGEAVFQAVAGGAGFACLGFGSGGLPGVGLIGKDLSSGSHICSPLGLVA